MPRVGLVGRVGRVGLLSLASLASWGWLSVGAAGVALAAEAAAMAAPHEPRSGVEPFPTALFARMLPMTALLALAMAVAIAGMLLESALQFQFIPRTGPS